MLGWNLPKIPNIFKSQLSEEERRQAREEGEKQGEERGREEGEKRFAEAAAGVIPEETIERIKDRMEQSRR